MEGADILALVLDVGTYNTKAGFGGDSLPKCVVPSVVGCAPVSDAAASESTSAAAATEPRSTSKYYYGLEQLELRRKDMEVRAALSNGLVNDWDTLERLWSHVLHTELRVDPQQHPLMLSEPVHTTQENRDRTASVFFEQHGVPALFTSKSAVLTAFAAGRSTALVFKSGGGRTYAVPVQDGFALTPKVVTAPTTGFSVSAQLLQALNARGDALKPRTALVKQATSGGDKFVDLDFSSFTQSYRDFWMGELAHDIKASGCLRIGPDSTTGEDKASTSFEMPDGKTIELGEDISSALAPEGFAPVADKDENATLPGPNSLAALIANAISGSELTLEAKKELYGTVVVTGGNTLLPGFVERLSADTVNYLNSQQPNLGSKLGFLAPRTSAERLFAAWIGGSIVSTLETFSTYWVTQSEYNEFGAKALHRKCP